VHNRKADHHPAFCQKNNAMRTEWPWWQHHTRIHHRNHLPDLKSKHSGLYKMWVKLPPFLKQNSAQYNTRVLELAEKDCGEVGIQVE